MVISSTFNIHNIKGIDNNSNNINCKHIKTTPTNMNNIYINTMNASDMNQYMIDSAMKTYNPDIDDIDTANTITSNTHNINNIYPNKKEGSQD